MPRLLSNAAPICLAVAVSAFWSSLTLADAQRSFCDLTVRPEIIAHKNRRLVKQFARKNLLTLKTSWGAECVRAPEVANELMRLRQDCTDYLRKHHASDIAFDDGGKAYGKHYYCSEPSYVVSDYKRYHGNPDPGIVCGQSVVFSIALMRADPIYSPSKTDEEIAEIKCGKLASCLARANTKAEIIEVTGLNQQLGCF
jgi:hypothetical protein